MKVSLHEAIDLVEIAISAKLVPFIHGSPALGKSAIIHQIANKHKLKMIDIRLSQCDPTDLLGMPKFEGIKVTYVPFDTFPLESDPIPDGYNGWCLFMDEANSAPRSVQAASYRIILDRMVGQHKLHDRVAIVCAGNLDTDGAITEEMSTALQSRLCHIEVYADLQEFLKYAMENNFDYRITSYLEFKPTSLYSFKPDHSDKTYSSPRTWEFCNKIMKKTNDYKKLLPLLSGVLSEGIAREFIAFMKHEDKLAKVSDIVANPTGIKIPEEPSVLYALTGALSHHINEETCKELALFIDRLPTEFQIITFRGIALKHKTKWAEKLRQDWVNKNFDKIM